MRAILSLLSPTQNLANREETIYVLSAAKRIDREVMRFAALSIILRPVHASLLRFHVLND